MEIKDFNTLKSYKEDADKNIQSGNYESAQILIRKGLEFTTKKIMSIRKYS